MRLLLLLQTIYITLSRALSPSDWRPVGQGDPLSDPTHVYSPPMVEHVHYWLEPRHRPRVDIPGTNKGPPMGFSQVYQHYQKHPQPYLEANPYRNSYNGPSKDLPMEHFSDLHSTSLHENHPFPHRTYYHSNHDPLHQSFNRDTYTHIESIPLTLSDEKQIIYEISSPLPPTTSLSNEIISLSLKPPPQHAVTVGQIAGWPQISTHLQPSNTNNQLITTNSINNYFKNQYTSSGLSTVPVKTADLSSSATTTSTTTTTTTTTTTKPPTTTPPVSLVIEGHSKVKKYGPLPDSTKTIQLLNHNHLTNKNDRQDCIDLPIAKVKEINKS
ncbi:hypothetical protein O3M35_007616 [Rhynocoris fuscipes]|uniref:Uncharacterized protein n=1 Tax=Rhynocoris fuscipes TaxID=488301 RepID=A0AAW1DBL8_9HEMI